MTSTDDLTTQLKAVPFLSSLSSRDLKHVAELGRTVTHAAGREVVVEGSGSVGFHLVLGGSAEVDVHGAARPPMTVGEHFGEISMLDGKPRTASVKAGPDGLTTFAITAWAFSGLVKKHPEMLEPIVQTLCARLRSSEASET